jgi:CreA protein
MPRMLVAVLAALLTLGPLVASAEEIGSVGYRFRWLGPNDKIVVDAFDDPEVPGVACYVSRAQTGGVSGAVGLAEDPGEASIACRQVGPIDESKLAGLRQGREVFGERASLVFKRTQVVRFYDSKRRALVYVSYTDRIIEGSPRNSISVVPVGR